jgi:hypothetical protein
MAYLRGLHIIGHLPWSSLTYDNHDKLEQVII